MTGAPASPWDALLKDYGGRPDPSEPLQAAQRAMRDRGLAFAEAYRSQAGVPDAMLDQIAKELRRVAYGEDANQVFGVVPPRSVRRRTPFARAHGRESTPAQIGYDPGCPNKWLGGNLRDRQARLLAYTEQMQRAMAARRPIPELLALWITTVFSAVAAGHDANDILGVRSRKGQRKDALLRRNRMRHALAWVAAASDPETPGAISKKKAIKLAASAFNLSPGSLQRRWKDSKANRDAVFELAGPGP